MNKITLSIDGMKCGMCESHVNDLIRKNFNIKKIKSSYKKNKTAIVCDDNISVDDVISVITKQGYRVENFHVEPYVKRGLFEKLL